MDNNKKIYTSYLVCLLILSFHFSVLGASNEKIKSEKSIIGRRVSSDENEKKDGETHTKSQSILESSTSATTGIGSDSSSLNASPSPSISLNSRSSRENGLTPNSADEVLVKERVSALSNSIQYNYLDEANWKSSDLTHSIGYNSLNDVIQYEKWLNKKWGYMVFGSIKKEEDTLKTSVTTDQNSITFSKKDITSYSGSKEPLILVIGGGVKNRLWQSPWLQINWGGLAYLQYTGQTKSAIGESKIETADFRTPSDYSVTETNLGERVESASTSLYMGPRLGAEVYLKWFPNVIIVADMQALMSFAAQRKIATNQTSQQYNVVSGVPQTPSSNTSSSNQETVNNGGTWGTNKIGSSQFGLTLTWGIRYSW